MSKLLYVIASPRGADSESTAAADVFLDTYRALHPDLEVDVLDLWRERLPVYAGRGAAAKMTAFAGEVPTGDEAQAWADIRRVFDRFDSAEMYLFAVPMWNAGVPWVLKHLIDTINQPGMTFGFTAEHGYVPLLTGKRAAVVYTSGVYSEGVAKAFGSDFHAAFFGDWLRFVGIDDIREVRFQPTAMTGDVLGDRDAAHERARAMAAEFDRSVAVL